MGGNEHSGDDRTGSVLTGGGQAAAGPEHRTVRPLDPPMVPFAIAGTAIWALAALVCWPLRAELAAAGHGSWFGICVAGFCWGLPGLATMLVHDANRRRRRAAQESGVSQESGAALGPTDAASTSASS